MRKVVQEEARAAPKLLRGHLAHRGIELSKKLKDGDFIIVEVDDKRLSEPWMLGRVKITDGRNAGPYVATDHVEEQDNWMGRIEPGGSVVRRRRAIA